MLVEVALVLGVPVAVVKVVDVVTVRHRLVAAPLAMDVLVLGVVVVLVVGGCRRHLGLTPLLDRLGVSLPGASKASRWCGFRRVVARPAAGRRATQRRPW